MVKKKTRKNEDGAQDLLSFNYIQYTCKQTRPVAFKSRLFVSWELVEHLAQIKNADYGNCPFYLSGLTIKSSSILSTIRMYTPKQGGGDGDMLGIPFLCPSIVASSSCERNDHMA